MRLMLSAASALSILALPALAGEISIPPEARSKLSVSVYASGNALVRERRQAQLPAGASKVVFQEVSPLLNPTTAWLSGEGVGIDSIDFLFDTLTPQTLLNRSLGKNVGVVRTNPATGAVTTEQATVLSVKGGPVLKIGDRIEAGMPEKLVFSQLPEGLRPEPAIMAHVKAPQAGKYDLDFSYQTGGLGWKAVYTGILGEKMDRLDLSGQAILTNTSGVRFAEARLSLLSGEPRRIAERPAPQYEDMQALESAPAPRLMMAKAAPPQAAEEDFGTLRAFQLPYAVTLDVNQTKQVHLLKDEGLKTSRDYVLEYGFNPASVRFQGAQAYEMRPEITLGFDVPKERNALPAGVVRIYQKDKSGELQLLGEDRLKAAVKGEAVKLSLGRAYDVSAKWRQTEYGMQSKQNVFEGDVAWEIEMQNAKAEEVAVRIVQPMTNQWSIIDSSHPHQKSSAHQAEWLVKIPAEGKAILKVKAHLKN